jgi:hypothetical protein
MWRRIFQIYPQHRISRGVAVEADDQWPGTLSLGADPPAEFNILIAEPDIMSAEKLRALALVPHHSVLTTLHLVSAFLSSMKYS